ncbi:MAG: DALR anticodon-binding domain-containing protein [Alphaproteobacteria bacterium]|nr:DALR anticodon-binding domain-containing protein [Alphaproteobacteria bacterium]
MSRKLQIQESFDAILKNDLTSCFEKDVTKIFQPKDPALGDVFIHLTNTTPQHFKKLSLLSWVSSYVYDEKGFLNIPIKDDVLLSMLNVPCISQPKDYAAPEIDDFDIHYCYARCCSIFKEATSIGFIPPYQISTLNNLTPIMRFLLIHLLLNQSTLLENYHEIKKTLKKISFIFNIAWQQNTGTRLRFIDERDMTKTNLNLAILTIVKITIDHHLARIGMKVLDELNI